ncbi:aspartic peptidase domain-containing protein [Suillus clintonianus]|uniref:aspartic peptidase domain-containing protein n=1 Tax=Suillus clintonianus TaxID=1904413 RepID=UPI001B872461|nr:aspartic peptidase domain-containing protein [Suillus clintonianus]KAG2124020.1 aspartic peptidase domain-containing protein [Suillus clintonianus]
MFPAASLLTTLLLALSIAASPVEVRNSPITLPIARRLNTSGGTINLLQHDQSRAAALKNAAASNIGRRAGSIAVTNDAVTYIAAVGVGSPATTYNLIVDTGSSNTWVGATTPYAMTSTSVNTGQPVAVSYGSGSFSGTEYTDTVTLGSGLTITQQSIGVASRSTGFTGVDGILGIGPLDLTEGTLTNSPTTTIPTVTQNLYTQGIISQVVVGVSFEPTTSQTVTNGELTFGGTDATKYTGAITYTPLTTTYPASYYWGINESITYGTKTILSATAGIVDTGTTLILIASNAFSTYQSATGATLDRRTGLLRITSTQYSALQNLNFNIGSNTYALTPNGQIWPRALNTYIGGTSTYIYLVVNSIGAPSGQGLDFINGYTFLERFYSVFDTTNSQVGFATTAYTTATTN